jgi:hypothetical protein
MPLRDLEMAPLRNLDEFILGESRFEMPDISDTGKWANRVVNNLLYYQTNYFISALIIFSLISFLHPGKMLLGMITLGVVFGALYYCAHTQVQVKTLKKNHPAVVMVATFCLGWFLVYQFGCILVFLSGVIFPLVFMIVHASLRLRNAKNKVTNVAETLGLGKKTPMGIFLDEFGIEPEVKYM